MGEMFHVNPEVLQAQLLFEVETADVNQIRMVYLFSTSERVSS